MKTFTLLRVLCVTVAMILFCGASTSVFAQPGGHGGGGGSHGGGGFHAGGGGGHSAYGGGYYGGYHGGGYGWHGGYGWNGGYGWHGGYGGYPRYGYGWGFGIGFGWGPYWPTYPYAYGYGPWWGAPYNDYPCAYPYYSPYYPPSGCPYSYPHPYNGSGSGSAQDPGWNGYDNSPAKPSGIPAPKTSPNAASVINVAASTRTAPSHKSVADTGAAHYQLAFTMQELPPARKEVQNVILALRAMPPDARQRQIDSGRYSNFSPEEIDLVRSSSHLPITW